MRIGEFLQQWLQHWINLLERWSEQCKLVVTDSFIWCIKNNLFDLVVGWHTCCTLGWDSILQQKEYQCSAQTNKNKVWSYKKLLKTIYVNSFSAGFNSYAGGVHTIKKSVLELILVIHPAGAYHVFPEHEVRLKVSQHPPWMGCQSIIRVPPVKLCWEFADSHLHIWIERSTVIEKCLPQEHNTTQWPSQVLNPDQWLHLL